MVIYRYLLNTIIASFLAVIVFSQETKAQFKQEYSVLSEYRKWGIIAGPVLYNKAKLNAQYGDYTFKNFPSIGFNAGIEYNFNPERKWSVTTGLFAALEPVYNMEYRIYKRDVDQYPEHQEDIVQQDRMYAMTSFSAPLLLKLNVQISRTSFMSLLSGLKMMYFPNGDGECIQAIISESLQAEREIFGLRAESPENAVQGSFIIGTEYTQAFRKMLIKTKLMYVMNFQNTMSGEYLFDNLFSSPSSRGYYDLSGNYIGLLFSFSFKKNIRDQQK